MANFVLHHGSGLGRPCHSLQRNKLKMDRYKFDISLDLTWEFDVDADNEDEAYERLWHIIGYDAEDIVQFDHEPYSEFMDISVEKVTP